MPKRKIGFKLCLACHAVLPLFKFARCATRADGYQAYCRTCHNTKGRRKYREANPVVKRFSARWRYRVKGQRIEKRCAHCGRWRHFSDFLYQPNHSDGAGSWCSDCRATASRKRWSAKTKNPRGGFVLTFQRSVRRTIENGSKRGRAWEALLGYTTQDLIKHFELQFCDGMSWDNYGEWEIDHIVPVAAFNFTKPDSPEFKACWSLQNLRPCRRVKNNRKGATIPGEVIWLDVVRGPSEQVNNRMALVL